MGNVQIPESLWQALWSYHIQGNHNHEVHEEIVEGLRKKGEAIKRRNLYTLSKQGDEYARQTYLDEIGIKEEFRW